MRKIFTYLCIGTAIFFTSCSSDDEIKEDASNLIYYNFGQIVTGEFQAKFVNQDDPTDFLEVSSGKFRLRVESYSEGRLDQGEKLKNGLP